VVRKFLVRIHPSKQGEFGTLRGEVWLQMTGMAKTPELRSRIGAYKVAIVLLVATIIVLSVALYSGWYESDHGDGTTDGESPARPSPDSFILNGTSLTITPNSIMWINTNESDREGLVGWDWHTLQVAVATNDSWVGWALYHAEETLSLGTPSVAGLGEGGVMEGSVLNLSFSLVVADITGNGYFDFGDYFIAYTENDSLLVPGTEWFIHLASNLGSVYMSWTFSISISEDGYEVLDITRYDFAPF
jgi:hypothetical protein